jgi:ferredoxin
MKIRIHRDRCIGAAQCVWVAPELFDQSDDGLVEIVGDVELVASSKLMEAANLCPSRTIELIED